MFENNYWQMYPDSVYYNQKERRTQNKKEITKMMIDFDTYEMIADLLMMGIDEPTYSVEEIAEIVGVDVEVVKYVDRAENDVM